MGIRIVLTGPSGIQVLDAGGRSPDRVVVEAWIIDSAAIVGKEVNWNFLPARMARMKPGNKLADAMRRGQSGSMPELDPSMISSVELCCALGEQKLAEEQPEAAIAYFKRAVDLDPGSVHGWFGRGFSYTLMKEYAASIEFYRKAIALDPTLAIAYHNLGRSLHETGQPDLAWEAFRQSLGLGFEATRKDVAVFIPGCPSASNQMVLAERKKWAQALAKTDGGRRNASAVSRDVDKHPLKIGYVSAFFHKDNWMKPVWGLLDQHDRESFQVHLFSDRTDLTPGIQAHLRPGDRFHDLSSLASDEAAAVIANHGIDILVDLNGYSYPQRFPVFLRKPAPLVVGWFNMYATTGFDCFDYLIGDDCVIPETEERWYSEKIVRVPGSYLTFNVAYDVPDVVEPPCTRDGVVTFGSLISQYKITGGVIDAWAAILDETPGSRLLIRNAFLGSRSNRQFLHARLEARGIAGDRITLEGPAPHVEFLQTYDHIDIALDAFPYNGGTTTTEAIWQGVPVVAWRGDRWVSRTSATLLQAAGLDELVADDVPGYISVAASLAREPEKLVSMRRNMREKLLASRACDTAGFARSMESIYRKILEN